MGIVLEKGVDKLIGKGEGRVDGGCVVDGMELEIICGVWIGGMSVLVRNEWGFGKDEVLKFVSELIDLIGFKSCDEYRV